ncbi:hypothetical protein M409DRAFT_70684 [Zasmidium cellare ATCC 36951]|uniref:Major facilitator superfamily (MFS) profile domain-containing protein n=1 Tax=Zasmidium cellare ATCC 36951 TaxID=1080233 RepID=A0A6A6C1N2_ZASCE|nr:uncharacterized protein M409DRAFT_70684 [Zasmidium cellare ATCC 36951]KAF2160178.1 hypothetical protein M409DRAFT_70684 [Zasmidium cellare ATCC 36951]
METLDKNTLDVHEANEATAAEHSLGVWAACKKYPKAVAWSAVVSLSFQKYYGHPQPGKPGKYQLDPTWQSALSFGSPVGNFIGVLLNGLLAERFGHKPVAIGALAAITALIFIQFFAADVSTLFAGQLLVGIPVGVFSTLAPAYASEVAPVALRSYFETFSCWGIGQFLSYAVILTLNTRMDHWAFRIPFAVQWVWPVIIALILIFCPESPWWYVQQQRYDRAKTSIKRLLSSKNTGASLEEEAEKQLALMIETDKFEKAQHATASFKSCFQGDNIWRTEIACFAWASQIWTGFAISSSASYFFQQAGLTANNSYKMSLGQGGIHLACNWISAWLSGPYGRRWPYIIACAFMTLMMIIIGILSSIPQTGTSIGFATSAVYLVWYAAWCLTLGPLPYIIVSEVPSAQLRSKTFILSRNSYVIFNIVQSVAAPYILNPEAANWKGKVGYLTAGLIVLCMIWAYFRLPETKGRTFEEIDILFSRKATTAKNFGKAVIVREGGEVEVRYD